MRRVADHVELDDIPEPPRATLAQRVRAPSNLLPPVYDFDDNTVSTNLAAILHIRRWYEALELQALIQLGLNPFNAEEDKEKLLRRIDVEMLAPPMDS